MNPLREVLSAGQSPWLDFVRRTLMTSGELQRSIEEDAITGVTSNPSIFGKAIGGSTDYDHEIQRLANDGADHEPLDVFFELAIPDIQMAADVLMPVYQRSDAVVLRFVDELGIVERRVGQRREHRSDRDRGLFHAARRFFFAAGFFDVARVFVALFLPPA